MRHAWAPAYGLLVTTTVIRVGDVTLTRVLYADAPIDPEPAGLSVADVRSVAWAEPRWAEGDQLRAAACAWVIESTDRTVVVDPAGNIDDILHDPETTGSHQEAFLAAFEQAGVDPTRVDTVLLSHIESVGFTAVRDAGGWRPFFPNSRLLISDRARANFDETTAGPLVFAAFRALIDAQLVDTFADGDEIVPKVFAEWTGAHNPGHAAFHVGDPCAVTFVGHLAVSPLHLATGPCPAQHSEPERAWEWLQRTSADGRWLIGPLWPSPGAGRCTGSGFEAFSST
jgi:hypothetical protein